MDPSKLESIEETLAAMAQAVAGIFLTLPAFDTIDELHSDPAIREKLKARIQRKTQNDDSSSVHW